MEKVNEILEQKDPAEKQEDLLPQSKVNEIAKKEKEKGKNSVLKELGLNSIDELSGIKSALEELNQYKESQKTEDEKKNDAIKKYEDELGLIKKEKEMLEFKLVANQKGVDGDSLEDVLLLAQRLVSDEVAIDAALDKVLEKYPHFKGGQKEQQPLVSFGNGQVNPPSNITLNPIQARIAKYAK